MRKKLGILLIAILVSSSGASWAAQVRLSAAASLTDATRSLILRFNREHSEVQIIANFAGSGSLAKQILHGAPADLYISANKKWITYLLEHNRLDSQNLFLAAYNELVFVGKKETRVTKLSDVTRLSLLAIGSPDSVPAGQYAAQAMKSVGVYDEMIKKHKLVIAKDVRQALLYADRGEVDGAFIYKTDARLARNCSVLFTVPPQLHDTITYFMALTTGGVENDSARQFFRFLQGAEARSILSTFGFLTHKETSND